MTHTSRPPSRRTGLVLSGGGAKGAYQVGILKSLVENNIQVDAVAGASIGALNAAVLASAPTLKEGTARLEELWLSLAASPPLKHNLPGYLHLVLNAGMTMASGPFSNLLARTTTSAGLALASIHQHRPGLLSQDPLQALMGKYFLQENIAKGLPLYVSVFKSHGAFRDIADATLAEIGIRDTAPSEFIHIQALPADEQQKVLLASSALPVLFAAENIDKQQYTDGGLGGWQKSQGNTPITPLLQAGITDIIVTHLSDASLWSRHDFPQATVLEIRPHTSMARDGGASDLLGFDAKKITSWIQQGYNDTQATVHRLAEINTARTSLRMSEQRIEAQLQNFPVLDKEMAAAMARINKP